MHILAVDTSLEACAVGVAGFGESPIILTETIGRGHAERLFGMIETALAQAGASIRDIERFAVTTGPGSFTGIRVGIAAMRGFALVTKRPALGFSTLAVHAAEARAIAGAKPVLAALPAKGGEIFAQAFDAEGAPLGVPAAGTPERFARLAAGLGAIVAGSGADAVTAVDPALAVVHRHSAPDMAAFLSLATNAPLQTGAPRPLYIRPPDAIAATDFAVARR